MIGALVLAAGVSRAFEQNDWRVVLLGYVILRLAYVVQWLRVARDSPASRPAALRYAYGFSVLQVLWVVLVLWSPSWFFVGFMGLFALELASPSGPTPRRAPRSTASTSPSGTACSRSSCWARPSSPRRSR